MSFRIALESGASVLLESGASALVEGGFTPPAAATHYTPSSSNCPYLTVDEFITLKDFSAVSELSVDDGTRPDLASLRSNPRLASVLGEVSGEIESALLASGRYKSADLCRPNGNSTFYLKSIAAKLAMFEMYNARDAPEPPDSVLTDYEEAQQKLEDLRTGKRILSFVQVADAGVTENEFVQPLDLFRQNRYTDNASRAFGLRNDVRGPKYRNT